ncbi:MAG: sugar phosphate isomerase/epimerase [Candidatus Atribacteria bacterium]|nr:sugar phosphate isomerase/epimerase [Candidatus Atribacteria bacterium]
MSKIKLSYVVATPELAINENVTAYQGKLEEAFEKLKMLGYDGAELMLIDPKRLELQEILNLSKKYGIEIPVICTGEVFGQEHLSFMDPDKKVRNNAIERMKEIIDFAEPFEAHVNVGRLRGRFYPEIPKEESLSWLYSAFEQITDYASDRNVFIILEPIPYIFCNNINSTQDGIEVIKKVNKDNFKLMIDLISVHLEDKSMERSFKEATPYLKHIHICDSNRLAPGYGNFDFQKIVSIIKSINYSGYLSVEIKQFPDRDVILKESIELIKPLIK